ncbi:beta-microseminoprotein-like [Oenanthe melanoleuca]|uniref:beta-microseminoprotein-like n=1 Tax=Oenanthe melanoleuca TaxID=2939378 RepID=UPI0024C1F3C2|nr:beta-microseminoprotein-like [Oenanthe melanoleuca]
MRSFLAFFVAVGSIVTLGYAACITVFREPGWPQKGCMINGKIYPFGRIERTEFCFTCDCDKYSIHCCSVVTHPPHYYGGECKIIFNRKRCDYDVVPKGDPSKACTVISRVG